MSFEIQENHILVDIHCSEICSTGILEQQLPSLITYYSNPSKYRCVTIVNVNQFILCHSVVKF